MMASSCTLVECYRGISAAQSELSYLCWTSLPQITSALLLTHYRTPFPLEWGLGLRLYMHQYIQPIKCGSQNARGYGVYGSTDPSTLFLLIKLYASVSLPVYALTIIVTYYTKTNKG